MVMTAKVAPSGKVFAKALQEAMPQIMRLDSKK